MVIQFIKKWFLLTVVTFLLLFILWLPVLHNKFNWNYFEIFKNFIYCGVFMLSSMIINAVVLKNGDHHKLTPLKLTLNGLLTTGLNLLLVLLSETLFADILWPDTSEEEILCSTYIFCIVASLLSQFYIVRYYTKLTLTQQRENLALTKAMLKSQLNPHFVFNSLNILTGLIGEDPDRAERFIISLSKTYRYIIDNIEKDIVPISDALIVTKEYVSILQTRFPESIELDISNVAFYSNERIVTMSMQLLIENAVRHNYPSPEHPLRIAVFKRGNNLVVRNSLYNDSNAHSSHIQHHGVGLKNLRQRYLMECDKEPLIEINRNGDKQFFEVSLPII